ncbi:hypothetical protein FOA52_012395 [Chlamydomonas sp. UWO 241]|nr:hypothetical protein FOA52_012395 [Chlamydomonas sp. UWO 241]
MTSLSTGMGHGMSAPGILPRPWLQMYGNFLKPKQSLEEPDDEGEPVELAPIQIMLPDEMLLLVLSKLTAYDLGAAACVCRDWMEVIQHPKLWEVACTEAFQMQYPDRAALSRLATTMYRGSWRRMFLEQPHVRFDGVYVSRNTYVKTGVADMSLRRAQHAVVIVAYYRYYRFFPDGTLLYRTSPSVVSTVAKTMRSHRDKSGHVADHVYSGRYLLKGSRVFVVFRLPNSRSTEIRSRLQLRGTCAGAFNRLDIESIVSYDREDGMQQSLLAPDPEPDSLPDAAGGSSREHRRGMTTAVLVPWYDTQTSVLNLPTSKMDIFITG